MEIGTVARELGVAPSTLRSWERRYHLVVPKRGPSGQRLYDSDQVLVLRQILAQVRRGVRTGAAHLAVRTPVPLNLVRHRFEPSPYAPLHARRAADALLGEGTDEQAAFHFRLVVSELVKNAVVHGAANEPVELEMQLFQEWVDLKVRNGGGRLRIKSLRSRPNDAGRGLEIVDALADAWAIDTGPRGTSVSVRLSLVAAPG